MTRYRCGQCEREFLADKPSCTDCGLDPATDKRHAKFFLELRTIHFDAPTHIEGLGVGFAACDPKFKVGTNNDAFTGEKKFVNCEKCKDSEAFKAKGPPPKPAGKAVIEFNPLPAIASRVPTAV